MIQDKFNNSKTLLRDYKPYVDDDIVLFNADLKSYADAERANMEGFVGEILDNYTLHSYVNAKGGFDRIISNINSVIDKSGVDFTGKRVLEFGAGICKLSAAISSRFNVKEIWCLDQAENLLREIAPRVIKIIGGDLSKFRFVLGDMNAAFELREKFDAIVCYGAVHHLHLPEYFFDSIGRILNPDGVILIVDEPTLPDIHILPGTPVANFKKYYFAIRRMGDNENSYTVGEYKNIFGKSWRSHSLHTKPYSVIMRFQPFFAFMSNFVLKRHQ
jgi:SAM-dependent methyltransferase